MTFHVCFSARILVCAKESQSGSVLCLNNKTFYLGCCQAAGMKVSYNLGARAAFKTNQQQQSAFS